MLFRSIIAYRGGKKITLASIPLAERYPNSNSLGTTKNIKANPTIDANISESPGKLESQSKITYRVQLGAFRQNVPYEVVTAFLKISVLGIDQVDDSRGLHVFYSGNFEQYEEAEIAKNTIVGNGVKDAFVVAFVNGEKTTVLRARQLGGR